MSLESRCLSLLLLTQNCHVRKRPRHTSISREERRSATFIQCAIAAIHSVQPQSWERKVPDARGKKTHIHIMKFTNAFVIAAVLVVGSAALVSSADATDDDALGHRRGLRKDKKKKVFTSTPKETSQEINRNGVATVRGNGNGRPNKFRMAKKNGVKDQYIVVLEDFIDEQDIEALADSFALIRNGKRKGKAFRRALKGFAINLSQEEAEILSQSAEVKYVEQDAEVTKNQIPIWGLDRIDQKNLPLDNAPYEPNGDGSMVTAYIIDTGIRITHNEFGGRATWGTNTIDGVDNDCDGHGTHVAGTVGGATYGVAKNVDLVAVKVLGCDGYGTNLSVLNGIEWMELNCDGKIKNGETSRCVANMSLGGGQSDAEDEAVNSAVVAGIPVVVAAGNSGEEGLPYANACNWSPAAATDAITVGSTTSSDSRSSFSNYGTCVDIFAPGSSILSTWNTDDNAGAYLSGTSMASPHVAGIAAILLGNNPGLTSAEVTSMITSSGTSSKVTNGGTGSPNILAYISSETSEPSSKPSSIPTAVLSSEPSSDPSSAPSGTPSSYPSSNPSRAPVEPSSMPSDMPSLLPSVEPSNAPTVTGSEPPSSLPSSEPSSTPSFGPSVTSSAVPSTNPSAPPSNAPSSGPSKAPSGSPTTPEPTVSNAPSTVYVPSASPSVSFSPSVAPSAGPSGAPSSNPTMTESDSPSLAPSISPSADPTAEPSTSPSIVPSLSPSTSPSGAPSVTASAEPTLSQIPSSKPSPVESQSPSLSPTAAPSNTESSSPSAAPSATVSAFPSSLPTETPPTSAPTKAPTKRQKSPKKCRKRAAGKICKKNWQCCSGSCIGATRRRNGVCA